MVLKQLTDIDNKQPTENFCTAKQMVITNFTINPTGQIIFAIPANGEIFIVTSFGVTGDKHI